MKSNKKVREWKMFALIDCKWGTIRETGSISFLKCANQCPTCKIVPITITENPPKCSCDCSACNDDCHKFCYNEVRCR